MFDRACLQIFHRSLNLLDPEHIRIEADRLVIPFPAVLHVHGHIVDHAGFTDLCEPVREVSVRVQLDQIPHFLDRLYEVFQILLNQRFTAGDADTVENAFALLKVSQHIIRIVEFIVVRYEDKIAVVAVRTLEVAAAGEYRRCHLARIIQHCHFLEAADLDAGVERLRVQIHAGVGRDLVQQVFEFSEIRIYRQFLAAFIPQIVQFIHDLQCPLRCVETLDAAVVFINL